MNTMRSTWFVLITLLTLSAGCLSHPKSDPLKDWQRYPSRNREQMSAAIAADYESYIYHLPPDEKRRVPGSNISYYWNTNGQKAVKISIPMNGIWREHVLIYNLDNERIKTHKYETGQQ